MTWESVQKPWAGPNSNVSYKICTSLLLILTTTFLVDEFILELDPNHDGEITEEEFMLVMKYIQQRTSTQFPPINHSQSNTHSVSNQSASGETLSQQQQHQMHLYESDKRKYGALLPKTGVYFLPDDKVIGFLK